uniref:Uncharacterized protein n=1 Tax=Anopheles funestus TaxID=62324 RepID=A0A4Y0BEV2_ANOFN
MADLKRVGNNGNVDCRAAKCIKLDSEKENEKEIKLGKQESNDVRIKKEHIKDKIKETNSSFKENIKPEAIAGIRNVCSSTPQQPLREANTKRQRVNIATNTDFTSDNVEGCAQYFSF